MKEKQPMLSSSDVGKDEDSVLSLLKKLESFERDLSGFQHNIGRLAKLSSGLVDRGHFDSANIKQKQVCGNTKIIFYELPFTKSDNIILILF